MSERRPFPPSPRRLALARAAGLTAASPMLVGAAAAIAAIAAAVGLARAAAAQLGGFITAAARAADGAPGTAAVTPGAMATHVLELALPLAGAAALAAACVHVAQTRALWLPRRTIPGAPVLPRREGARMALELVSATVIGVVALGWLWLTAPRLAQLVQVPSAAGAALASLLVALAIAWVVLAIIDALVRRAQLAGALAMTREDKREDDRLAAADPRWRQQHLAVMRGPAVAEAVARAAIVVLGDDIAVAIEWDATRQPVPLRTAVGRAARATQLVALARRQRVPVHRDAHLTTQLAGGEGPVPDALWPRLAELVAAVRRGG